jgi:hypothetical protein
VLQVLVQLLLLLLVLQVLLRVSVVLQRGAVALQLVLPLAVQVRSSVQEALAMQRAAAVAVQAVAVVCPDVELAVCATVRTQWPFKQQPCTSSCSSSSAVAVALQHSTRSQLLVCCGCH